jgi:hypothetical protein
VHEDRVARLPEQPAASKGAGNRRKRAAASKASYAGSSAGEASPSPRQGGGRFTPSSAAASPVRRGARARNGLAQG